MLRSLCAVPIIDLAYYESVFCMAVSGKSIEVCSLGIHTMRDGTGAPLLFLHGANGVAGWSPFFAELANDFDVIVPEHPCFGKSDDAPWIADVPDLAMFYIGFLEQLNLRDVHIVGTSLGGWIAAEIASRDSSRIASVTLVAPAGVGLSDTPPGDYSSWSAAQLTRNLVFDQSIAERLLSAQPTPEQLELQVRNCRAATKFVWEPGLVSPALEKWLHLIKIPTSILWGTQDKLLPVAYADRWRQLIPQASVTLIDDCGHLPHVERAATLSSSIKSFISSIPN